MDPVGGCVTLLASGQLLGWVKSTRGSAGGEGTGQGVWQHSAGAQLRWPRGGWKESRGGPARMLAVCFSVDKGTLWPEHEVTEAGWQLNDEEE